MSSRRRRAKQGALEITPDGALAERAWRELARRRLEAFGQYIYPWWAPGAHHALVCRELEQVFRYIESGGEEGTGALIVEMPPQHGKTTLVSQIFPTWVLGKRPDSRIMLTAYGADLAGDNSRAVRQAVAGERFAAVFGELSAVDEPVKLSEDSYARANWNLAEPARGGLVAVGVGGGATGRPVDLVVVDDPFKSREEADSETERKKKLTWLTTSILSRLRKGSAIIMIHTRWHREDTIGAMLKAMATDPRARQWQVVSLPALPLEVEEYATSQAEHHQALLEGLWRPDSDPLGRTPGCPQPLWDEQFPMPVLTRIRATYEANGQLPEWYALYQQQPRPAEGAFFSSKDFHVVPKAPAGLQWFRYVDLALGKTKLADWNSTAAVGMDKEGNLFVRDMIRVHSWVEFRERLPVAMLAEEERGTIWGVEATAFQELAFQELMRDARLARVAIRAYTPSVDKVTRARPLQYRAKAGKVYLVEGPWVQQLILEALDFPAGRHDDQIDTVSGGLEMLAEAAGGQGQTVTTPAAVQTYAELGL